ncbi:MAG TPA: type 1 glutamine amidotransferase domain-containing protein [Terriglobales bacterium]|nr:type 1 glutamine amidotransferase domain-containing protein [Terriglobales bacterium]
MAEKNLEGLRVAILATDGVEEVELTKPRKALDDAGAKTVLIAPKGGKIQAMKHHDKSGQLNVDTKLSDARPEDFDALLLPGGALNADALRVEEKAQEFARQMDQVRKPIAVICHGPWLLISAGLVKGHTLTSYHTIRDDVRNGGGQWVDEETVRDQNWVSSRQPEDIPAFNREMIALFAEKGGQTRKAA